MVKTKNIISGTIRQVGFEEFRDKFGAEPEDKIAYMKVMTNEIEQLPRFAMGPYFWFVSTNNLEVLQTSNNLHELSPYKKGEWEKHYPNFLQPIIPTEDFNYFMGASAFMVDFLERIPIPKRKNFRFCIYCRMMDKKKRLRWVAFQFPKIIFNEAGKSVCGLATITDLAVFDIVNQPRMTIMDIANKTNPFYAAIVDEKRIENLALPQITRREREILACIVKGMTTPEIAKQLFISYDTVENHKKNLRRKTNTHTAGELVSYILQNQLL